MRFKHYYVMTQPHDGKFTNGKTITSLYEDAPDEVIEAVETPCAWEKPPRDCYKDPPPDKNIPIIKEPVMRNNDELIAEIIPRNTSNLESRRKMVLATNNNNDVLQYNREWLKARFAERQGEVYGGAKNKKKQRFRTKRRRSASRRKASRRSASRRNAPRRRTDKK